MAKVVKPVDAAGLVLIRAGSRGGPEILLGRRHRRAGFLPDIYVVPGGRVDTADNAPSGFAEALHPAVSAALSSGGSRRPALAFPRAALRETHEETGLLVGTGGQPAQQPLQPIWRAPIWQAYAAAGLVPDFGAIDFICRAITPVTSARRYNTRFFLADGAQAVGSVASNGELEDLAWRPVSALGGLDIVDVTEYVLKEALRRWQARCPAGAEPPKLLNYRNDIMTLSRHRARPAPSRP
jgi:8-oxo-dGTP pyrophosphatase MutT (NUDIX family)